MPNTKIEFWRYAILNAPSGCLDVVLACAVDGASHWEDLFQHGLPDAIAGNSSLERRLFRDLCIDDVKVHANAIVRSYLAELSRDHHDQFFAAPALQHKNHPANDIFSQAAFKTQSGSRALKLMSTLIEAGLQGERLQALATRRHRDVRKACKQGNQAFLKVLFQNMQSVPIEFLLYVVKDPTYGPSLVSSLLGSKTVPLARFLDPQVRNNANADTEAFISALGARAERTLSRF